VSHERRIFVSLHSPAVVGDYLTLTQENVKHLIRVLRLASGANVTAINSEHLQSLDCSLELRGQEAVLKVNKVASCQARLNHRYHLIAGLCKHDKNELILQKATELSASSITFCSMQNSVAEFKRMDSKLERWGKIIVEAAKQSGNNYPPTIRLTESLEELNSPEESFKLFCSLSDQALPVRALEKPSPSAEIYLVIGPEGGFSEQEETWLKTQNYAPISLAPLRLRSETACLASLVACQTLWG